MDNLQEDLCFIRDILYDIEEKGQCDIYSTSKHRVEALAKLIHDMQARIGRLEKENAKSREAREWKDIESAPKDGTKIITLVNGFLPTVGWWELRYWTNPDLENDIVESNLSNEEIEESYKPTHWMYLPESPKE